MRETVAVFGMAFVAVVASTPCRTAHLCKASSDRRQKAKPAARVGLTAIVQLENGSKQRRLHRPMLPRRFTPTHVGAGGVKGVRTPLRLERRANPRGLSNFAELASRRIAVGIVHRCVNVRFVRRACTPPHLPKRDSGEPQFQKGIDFARTAFTRPKLNLNDNEQ